MTKIWQLTVLDHCVYIVYIPYVSVVFSDSVALEGFEAFRFTSVTDHVSACAVQMRLDRQF